MRNLDSVYALAPDIEMRLHAFQQGAFAPLEGLGARIRRFLWLRPRSRRLAREIRREAAQALRRLGRERQLSAQARRLNYRLAAAQVDWFLDAVVKTAQLAGWERCFSLWHLVHVPFLYLLLVSGIVHVVAVHMY